MNDRRPLLMAATTAVALLSAACGDSSDPEVRVTVRQADQVQVMSADEAQALLDRSAGNAGGVTRVDAEVSETDDEDELAVTEASRSFQTRLGTALTVFNSCLGELGYEFVGIPGQTDDPRAADGGYIGALISCNNESGIGQILQEQGTRQASLTPEQKTSLNEAGREVFNCLVDRQWDLGELVANEAGILGPSRFPQVPPERQLEFQRDLDECGWNDLDLG